MKLEGGQEKGVGVGGVVEGFWRKLDPKDKTIGETINCLEINERGQDLMLASSSSSDSFKM